jgi:hypothetical protein
MAESEESPESFLHPIPWVTVDQPYLPPKFFDLCFIGSVGFDDHFTD